MSAIIHHMLDAPPAPVAPFSHAVEVDGWVFVTGQIPENPDDEDEPLPVGIEAQTRRVMENLKLVLAEIGLGPGARGGGKGLHHRHARIRDHEQDLCIVLSPEQAAGTNLHRRNRVG